MATRKLAEILSKMYHLAPNGETAVSVHLFGIKYAAELEGVSLKELSQDARIPETYQAEIRKGMNLSRYVEIKDLPKISN